MLRLLDAMFASFAVANGDRGGKPAATDDLVCSVFERHGERAEIRVGKRRYRVRKRLDAVGLGYMVLLQATLRRIKSHLIVHSGSLERGGFGILLAGGSGAGKSTLVLELVRRGFKLLSDDVGAIRLGDGLLEPFPRSLGFVSGRELGGVPAEMRAAMPMIGGGEKLLLRPEGLGSGRIGRACPLSLLIFLPGGSERLSESESLHVVFSELAEGLRHVFENLPGITGLEDVPNRLFPELRFRTSIPGRTLRQIDATCARYATAILETSRGDPRTVHTDESPTLTPLAKSEAARALLRRLHVAQDSALVRETFGGSGGRLLLELARLVDGVRCATLSVGRLGERADRVCEAVAELERVA